MSLYWECSLGLLSFSSLEFRPKIVQGIQHYPKRELNLFLIVSFLLVCYKKVCFPSCRVIPTFSMWKNIFIFKKAHICSFFKKAKSYNLARWTGQTAWVSWFYIPLEYWMPEGHVKYKPVVKSTKSKQHQFFSQWIWHLLFEKSQLQNSIAFSYEEVHKVPTFTDTHVWVSSTWNKS